MDAEALLSARRLSFASPRDVPPPILRSWLRCAEAGLDSAARPTVEPMPDDVLGSVRGRGVNSRTALAGIGVAIGPCG